MASLTVKKNHSDPKCAKNLESSSLEMTKAPGFANANCNHKAPTFGLH